MIRTRNNDTAAEAAQDEDQAAEAVAEAEAVPDDLAAAAVELRQAAEAADEEAIRCRAEAESVMSASRAAAERTIAEGQAQALSWIAKATALERQSAKDGGESKHHEHAARQEALAIKHEAKAAELAAELERAAETIAGLDSRLRELGADRERLEAAVAAARVAGDVSLIAEGRRQLDATVEAIDELGGQRETAQVRVRQGGDGTKAAPGELLDALTAAETHRRALTEALDELYPDRPGAEFRRDLATLKGTLEANMARIAEEAEPEQDGRRRHGYAGNR